MMMLAVMYGMTPSAKIEKLPKAPPENRFKNPSAPCDSDASRNWLIAWASTPGALSDTPMRYTAKMKSVNSTLLRKSATVKRLLILENIVLLCFLVSEN